MEASKRSGIAPFHVMEVMKAAGERQRLTGDVIHLEVGQPSTPAPSEARAAAIRAIADDRLGYTDAWGTAALRSRIGRLYADRYGVEPLVDRVVVTVGASGGFVLALLAAFDVGDRVAITEPGYAAYRNIMQALGIELAADSQALCRHWLDDLGVACTPGIDFDPDQGHRYVRMSYSESTADVVEAVRRITGWTKRMGR